MTTDTQQWIYRLIAAVFSVTAAVAVLGIIVIDGLAVFHFGDGEAISILGTLNGPLIAIAGVLGVGTAGHAALTALLGRLFAPTVSVANPGASSTVSTVTTVTPSAPAPAAGT